MQATLPVELEDKMLRNLPKNQRVYTTPWAMYADADGKLWLNGNYTYTAKPQGTSELLVWYDDEGYICDKTKCANYRWTRGTPCFMGTHEPLPVSKLI